MLYVAKDVFLEMGFERASMDVIATRAATSKRTLYAHFASKEKLYFAVIDLVHELFLNRIKTPRDYGDDVAEALVLFCGRFLEVLLFAPTIRMCRLCIAEATRFPEGAARYFDANFTAVHQRLSAYLEETVGLSAQASLEAAEQLLGRIIHPRFPRALFGVDALSEQIDDAVIRADFDLAPIRNAVAELIPSIESRSANPRCA